MNYINLSGYNIPKKIFDELNAFERHKLMMSLRLLEKEKNKSDNEQYLNDYDILKKKYNFIHDSTEKNSLLQNYYNSICNKYVICDLTKYKESKIGLRWRTEEEIISGKGHIICSSKKCNNTDLKTYEFLFEYIEGGEKKETKVNVRACMDCAYKLHYRKIKEYLKKKEKKKMKRKRRKKRYKKGDSSSECNSPSSAHNPKNSKLKKENLFYVKRKLEKFSLKTKEDKNDNNTYFHDLLF
ncbi:conserved protein, unknown function [Plasmodium gallinaceum]|uniref:Protein FRA10AC1 n=1 Tax=Plasmodium gallinaceum TaxID=5849 RepID=A0A1J1GM24_PLAGA|nr:conserved protein, unknown function [Plasmodium gallinaceum]CRG93379.1 conserved protein, unknown function [Plasmodium gallinaceum]